MYKILLADNEGVVLRSLSYMIYQHFGQDCDVRIAQTARYTRTLAHKFCPDIAVINIQMPGIHGFDIIREIRALQPKCVFITVVVSDKPYLQLEARNMNALAHLRKPLLRDRILPALQSAIDAVDLLQKRQEQNRIIQERFDMAIPFLENDLINHLHFPEEYKKALSSYRTLLNLTADYGRILSFTFGESADISQNPVGSVIRLHRKYLKFRDLLLSHFPDIITGPVMANHVYALLPCTEAMLSADDGKAFQETLADLLALLNESLEGLTFSASAGEILPLEELCLPSFTDI